MRPDAAHPGVAPPEPRPYRIGVNALALLVALAAASPDRIYVSNEGSGDLSVIDAVRDEVVATVSLGLRPRGIRVDGRGRIFVALSGSPRQPPGVSPDSLPAADRSADGIAIVDPRTLRVVSVLPSGQDPESFDLVPGGRLVVSNEETASASVVDVASARILATVAVGEEPEGVATAPGGRIVAVSAEESHRVELLDPAAARVLASVPTCRRPRGVLFSPDGKLAFAACENEAAVQVIDVPGRRAAERIALPEGSLPMGLAISRDGARLWVSNGRARTVSAIDVRSRKVIATARDVGARCWGITLGPDGKKLYVANGPSDDVTVLDARTLAVKKRIKVGALPWGVAASR